MSVRQQGTWLEPSFARVTTPKYIRLTYGSDWTGNTVRIDSFVVRALKKYLGARILFFLAECFSSNFGCRTSPPFISRARSAIGATPRCGRSSDSLELKMVGGVRENHLSNLPVLD